MALGAVAVGLPVMLMVGPAAAWFGKPAPQYRLIEDGDLLGAEWASPLLRVAFALLIVSVLTSVASLALRYRHAGQLERHQLKWIMLATSVLAAHRNDRWRLCAVGAWKRVTGGEGRGVRLGFLSG